MKKIILLVNSLLLLLTLNLQFVLGSAKKEPATVSQLKTVRVQEPITIDGSLTESIWQKPGETNFFQREPNQGEPSSQKTEIWVAYDDNAIYIAAKLYDSAPDSILKNLARRDYSTLSDQFYVYLDTYHDKRSGFYFGITPAGQLKDGILQNDEGTDSSWDGVWEGKAQVTNDGWTLELRIPFSQLRFKEQPEYVWGINFRRDIPRKNEEDYLVYTPRSQSGFTSRFPALVGLSNITPPQRFEIKPYVTTKAEFLKREKGDPFNDGSKYTPDLGIDFKYGLGTNLTLDATINPDFGQVEVDPAVVNLSDVETFYSEQRPFFVEGSSIFNFGYGGAKSNWSFNWSGPDFFYTRRIGRSPQGSVNSFDYIDQPLGTRIIGAVKITGRIFNDWKFGAVQAVTNREYSRIQIDGKKSRIEVEPLTYYGVIRTQRDFDKGKQGIGILTTYTNRFFKGGDLKNQINGNALVTGVDGWSFLDKDRTYVLTGWLVGSSVHGSTIQITSLQENSTHYFQRPDLNLKVDTSATSLSGMAGRVALNKQKGASILNAAFGVISPGFEINDLGYQSRTNIVNWHIGSGYKWEVPTKYYRSIYLSAAIFQSKDFNWNTIGGGSYLEGDITLPNFYSYGIYYIYGIPVLNTRATRGGPAIKVDNNQSFGVSMSSNQSKKVTFHINYSYEKYEGSSANYHAGISVKPWSSFSFSTCLNLYKWSYNIQWLDSYSDPLATQTYGKRYVFGKLNQTELSVDIRLDWLFSPNLSLQLYIQPYISTGKYNNIKFLAKSQTDKYTIYGEGGTTIVKSTDTDGNPIYTIDADGLGASQAYQIDNPDYRMISLRGNAVLRWEFKAGSTFYLVWNQNRYNNIDDGNFRFNHSMNDMFSIKADNVFMVKFSYWFGR